MSKCFQEPRLVDLLQDPLTEIMMARDGISQDALMSLLSWAAAQRGAEAPPPRPDQPDAGSERRASP